MPTNLTAELAQYVPDLLGRISLPMELFQRIRAALAAVAVQGEPQLVEPFVVKYYTDDRYPSIKGNGWDGLRVGDDRDEAEEFVKWLNGRLAAAQPARQGEQRKPLSKILAEARASETYRVESEALEREWQVEQGTDIPLEQLDNLYADVAGASSEIMENMAAEDFGNTVLKYWLAIRAALSAAPSKPINILELMDAVRRHGCQMTNSEILRLIRGGSSEPKVAAYEQAGNAMADAFDRHDLKALNNAVMEYRALRPLAQKEPKT